jgi:hypothetical protein
VKPLFDLNEAKWQHPSESIMCEDHCKIFTPDGKMIDIDSMHLTVAGSHYLAPKLASRYGNIFPGIIH